MIDKFLAALVTLLGLMVMTGWFLHSPALVQIQPGFVYMSFNTSLLFTLLGLTILIPDRFTRLRKNAYLVVSFIVITLAVMVISQDFLDTNYGIDQLFMHQEWLNNFSQTPGRMAPQTSVCFILSGLCILVLLVKSKWLNFIVPILAIIIMGIAVLSFTGYWLNLEIMYSWYKYTRMPVHTAVGFILLAPALWILWYRSSDDTGIFLNREDRKISAIAVGILSIIALSAGMISFTLLAKQLENSTKENFSTILDNNSDLIRYMLKESVLSSREITNHPLMNRQIKEYSETSSPEALESIHKVLKSVSGENYSQVSIYNVSGDKLAEIGESVEMPELSIKLDKNNQLLWNDGAYLLSEFELSSDGVIVGSVIVERHLQSLTEIFKHGQNIGKTGELLVCSAVTLETMNCLPSRSHPAVFKNQPRKFEGQSIVMDYTLRGEPGFHVGPDYSGHKVISVGELIKPFPLGIVLKIDSRELYAPIRVKLNWMVGIVIALVAFGIILLRSQLVPLVRKVIISEQLTRINEERLHLATTGTSDGLWDWDVTTNHLYYSPRFVEMLGYTEDEFPHHLDTWSNLLHPDDKESTMKNVQRSFDKIAPYNNEYRLLHKSGEYIWFNARGQTSWDENGKPVRMTGFLTDIRHRKEADRLKNEFVSIVSHELRTPLTSIRGSLGLLLSGVGGELTTKVKNLIEIAHKNCERLVLLINDILDIEKIESGQMRFELAWCDIGRIIEQAVELNHSFAEKHNVKFVIERPISGAEVNVDTSRLIQVITNLLSNAAKFSGESGEVLISTEENENTVKVSVTDTGWGIPQEFQSQIFSKFAQADSSAIRQKGGTGLGLNISKAIIEKLHGTIGFTTEEGKGSTFFFTLPKARSNDGKTKATARLLICEDDEDIAQMLKQILETQNYFADIASTAAEAEQMLVKSNYEGLILDLILPDKDGFKFIEELRLNESTKKLPIIVVSAKTEHGGNTLEGRALEVVDWLSKPYDEERLIKAVRRIPSLSGKATILHVEDDEDVAKIIAYGLLEIANVISASSLAQAKEYLAKEDIDLVLLDISLPDGSGLKLLETLNGGTPKPVIIFSATEVSRDISEKVEAALVKSRTSEAVIISTIQSLLVRK